MSVIRDSDRPVIVVIDDEAEALEVLVAILEDDYEVIGCNGGKQALDVLDSNPNAVVLCDQRMPALTGDEVLVRIRILYPETIRILVSAYTDVQAVVRALNEGGIFGFVQKPFEADELRDTVARAIQQRDMAKEKSRLVKEINLLRDEVTGIVRERTKALEEENRELKDLSIRDELTSVFNRRYLDVRLIDECNRQRRYGQPLGVIMADIDDFKKINDSYGHQVGDNVLKQVAACLVKGTRDVDFVSRYGGEEFLILAPNTDEAGARNLAERLRASIEAISPAPSKDGPSGVTISIGVSSCDDGSVTDIADELVRRADEAMYLAKKQGKNRVITWTEVKAFLKSKPQSVFVRKTDGEA